MTPLIISFALAVALFFVYRKGGVAIPRGVDLSKIEFGSNGKAVKLGLLGVATYLYVTTEWSKLSPVKWADSWLKKLAADDQAFLVGVIEWLPWVIIIVVAIWIIRSGGATVSPASQGSKEKSAGDKVVSAGSKLFGNLILLASLAAITLFFFETYGSTKKNNTTVVIGVDLASKSEEVVVMGPYSEAKVFMKNNTLANSRAGLLLIACPEAEVKGLRLTFTLRGDGTNWNRFRFSEESQALLGSLKGAEVDVKFTRRVALSECSTVVKK